MSNRPRLPRLNTFPVNAVTGQTFFHTGKMLPYYYTGSGWRPLNTGPNAKLEDQSQLSDVLDHVLTFPNQVQNTHSDEFETTVELPEQNSLDDELFTVNGDITPPDDFAFYSSTGQETVHIPSLSFVARESTWIRESSPSSKGSTSSFINVQGPAALGGNRAKAYVGFDFGMFSNITMTSPTGARSTQNFSIYARYQTSTGDLRTSFTLSYSAYRYFNPPNLVDHTWNTNDGGLPFGTKSLIATGSNTVNTDTFAFEPFGLIGTTADDVINNHDYLLYEFSSTETDADIRIIGVPYSTLPERRPRADLNNLYVL